MELEQLRQALLKLNEFHQGAASTKNLRKGRDTEKSFGSDLTANGTSGRES